jgi:peptidyl-prolyl cis-trans isomerase B (cyclophilin B)
VTRSHRFPWLGLAFALVLALPARVPGQGAIGDGARRLDRPKLSSSDIDDIATLLRLEDTRQFDETALGRILKSAHPEVRRRAVVSIGRIVAPQGSALLETARADADPEVRASVAFASGQLKDPSAVAWLNDLLASSGTAPRIAREAAQALGKILTPAARTALANYLNGAKSSPDADNTIGEALLSMGRFQAGEDLAPITRWMTARNAEIRWRVAWALFRPRDPNAAPFLMKLTDDESPEVRFWAVRGLAPVVVDKGGLDRKAVTAKLRAGTLDKDRRVRTESLRALLQFDDDVAFGALLEGLASPDPWISTSAAENLGHFSSRAAELKPKLVAAVAASKSLWFRQLSLGTLSTLAPDTAVDVATSLVRSGAASLRNPAVTALGRMGGAGEAKLAELRADPALSGLIPAPGAGRGGGGAAPQQTPAPRSEADYRRLVEKWVVPAYEGKANPHAIWDTSRGQIEIELFPGEAPMGVECFLQLVTSGDIVGTEFSRVVPNFVDQQQTIRNAPRLRDEVNRIGLNRGTLAWASGGLDTGRPGYTLGSTPQPHNEGNFTSLGRVVNGMKAVDTIELGDKILAARMK